EVRGPVALARSADAGDPGPDVSPQHRHLSGRRHVPALAARPLRLLRGTDRTGAGRQYADHRALRDGSGALALRPESVEGVGPRRLPLLRRLRAPPIR